MDRRTFLKAVVAVPLAATCVRQSVSVDEIGEVVERYLLSTKPLLSDAALHDLWEASEYPWHSYYVTVSTTLHDDD